MRAPRSVSRVVLPPVVLAPVLLAVAVLAAPLGPTLRADEGPPAPQAPKAPAPQDPAPEDPAAQDPVLAALLDPPATGLLVLLVVPGSPAAGLALEPGSILLTYNGTAVGTPEVLKAAMQATGDAKDVDLVVRTPAGETKTHKVAPGRLGVHLRGVVKGEGLPPLPPVTHPTLDLERLGEGAGERWYALRIESSGTKGYEHRRVSKAEDGTVVLDHEVAFDGGERWGRMHSIVRVTVRREGIDVRFKDAIQGRSTEVTLRPKEGGGTILGISGAGATEEVVLPPGAPVVPSYLVESLATLLPAEPNASFHYRSLSEGNGQVGLLGALTVRRPETVDVGGTPTEAWRVEALGLGNEEPMVFWVKDGRVVRADYGDAVTTAASQEDALRDVAEDLRPK